MSTAIWWVRRDLRLADNQALQQALANASAVLPVFILDQHLLAGRYSSKKRTAFLFGALRDLDAQLRQRGSALVIRQGKPEQELSRLVAESHATAIYAEADYSPYARDRDGHIWARLPLRLAGSPAVHPPESVLKSDGTPYTVFTPYSKAWKQHTFPLSTRLELPPERVPGPPGLLALAQAGVPAGPALPASLPFPATSAEAHARLQQFIAGPVYAYGQARDRMDQEGTSRLSPYLRFGLLSARQAAAAALSAIRNAPDAETRKSAETWLNELVWREFYIQILANFPHVRSSNFRLHGIPWLDDPQALQAWQEGRTGYPVVDAAMRQLQITGWMHNRARMIVASFLTKDLLIDWRLGEEYFMQHLLDGDPAANNGGWQWTAGTGTDAAPYFRVFNPLLQSARCDPQGAYIRRWLPELRALPDEYLHAPWTAPNDVQRQVGVRIGRDYPAPIVDHAFAKERALAAYGQARG